MDFEIARKIYEIHHVPSTFPNYSSSSAAMEIFIRMVNRPFSVRQRFYCALQEQARLSCELEVAWPDVLTVLAHDLPLAICRAALKAVNHA
jgi:hypothetical protein